MKKICVKNAFDYNASAVIGKMNSNHNAPLYTINDKDTFVLTRNVSWV